MQNIGGKSECVRRTWIPTTSLVIPSSPLRPETVSFCWGERRQNKADCQAVVGLSAHLAPHRLNAKLYPLIGANLTKRSNVPFPSRDLFPLGAPPTDRALSDLWIAASTFAKLGRAPRPTCARQGTPPIDVTLPCRACRRASSPEPATGSRTSFLHQRRQATRRPDRPYGIGLHKRLCRHLDRCAHHSGAFAGRHAGRARHW